MQRRVQHGAGRRSHHDAIGPRKCDAGGKCLLVRHRDDVVEQLPFEDRREMLIGQIADPLQPGELVLPAGRLDADDPDPRILLLEEAANAGNRAARTDRGKKVVDVAAGLIPDLRPRRSIVRLDVERAFVLIRTHVTTAIGLAFDHAPDDAARSFARVQRTQFVFDLDQLGAEEAQQCLFLFRGTVRDRDFDRHAGCVCQCCKGDAGIARGRLHDRLPGVQIQASQHVKCGAVLDRTEGIHALELEQHLVVGVRVRALAEAHHRCRVMRIRHQVRDRVIDAAAMTHPRLRIVGSVAGIEMPDVLSKILWRRRFNGDGLLEGIDSHDDSLRGRVPDSSHQQDG